MKIDLHRHLGGSISPETVWEIIQHQPELASTAGSINELYDMMTFRNDTNYNFYHFLRKFEVLNNIKWDEKSIDLALKQVIQDIANENIKYCELRFSVTKYLSHTLWDEVEACLFCLDRMKHWSNEFGVKIGPVLSIKYEASKIEQQRMSKLVNHWRIAEQLVGLDFIGNEAFFDSKSLSRIYRYWRMCGKGLLIHAGESQSAEHVRIAIQDLKVNRIAHGIAAANHPDILQMAVDNNVAFDISIKSNQYTGVVEDINNHPIIKMIDAGCNITIGTDDPVTLSTTMNDEYELAANILGEELRGPLMVEIYDNSFHHSLITPVLD